MNVVNQAPYRILVTKIGLDGHDRGSRIVAAYLRDAGMEVIYTPPWQALDDVVRLAGDEDVDVIGISSLSTDHLIIPDLMSRLVAAGLLNIRVVVGGIVPNEELSMLLESLFARPSQHRYSNRHAPYRIEICRFLLTNLMI